MEDFAPNESKSNIKKSDDSNWGNDKSSNDFRKKSTDQIVTDMDNDHVTRKQSESIKKYETQKSSPNEDFAFEESMQNSKKSDNSSRMKKKTRVWLA